MASEVDVTRTINAVFATLNDQKLQEFDAARLQEITTGALDGEQKLIAYGSGTSGELRDGDVDGPAVARFTFERGKWSAERVPAARKSDQLQQYEEQRTKETETEFQKPVRGRLAIWKKKLSGS
jgi:hypothetical protein